MIRLWLRTTSQERATSEPASTRQGFVEIIAHRSLDMPEAVSAQLFSAVPARNHNNMVPQPFSLQHPNDHHSGTRFTIIILNRNGVVQERPGIVTCPGELLFSAELFYERFGLFR